MAAGTNDEDERFVPSLFEGEERERERKWVRYVHLSEERNRRLSSLELDRTEGILANDRSDRPSTTRIISFVKKENGTGQTWEETKGRK